MPEITPKQILKQLPKHKERLFAIMRVYSQQDLYSDSWEIATDLVLKEIQIYQRHLKQLLGIYYHFSVDPESLQYPFNPKILSAFITRLTFFCNGICLLSMIGGKDVPPDIFKSQIKLYEEGFNKLLKEDGENLIQGTKVITGVDVALNLNSTALKEVLTEYRVTERELKKFYQTTNFLEDCHIDKRMSQIQFSCAWSLYHFPKKLSHYSQSDKRQIAMHAILTAGMFNREKVTNVIFSRYASFITYNYLKKGSGKLPIISYKAWLNLTDENTTNITLH